MGFFDDFKEDLSQAVGEINAAGEEESSEKGIEGFPDTMGDGIQETLNLSEMIEKETEAVMDEAPAPELSFDFDAIPAEESAAAPEEIPEELPAEEPVEEEAILEEELPVEEPVQEEVLLEEELPIEEPVMEEELSAEEPVEEEAVLEKELPAEEPVEEEPVMEEELSVEEPVMEEELPAEEPVPEEELPVEEPAAEEAPIEEAAAEPEPEPEPIIAEAAMNMVMDNSFTETATEEETAFAEADNNDNKEYKEMKDDIINNELVFPELEDGPEADENGSVTAGMIINGDIISQGSLEVVGTVKGNINVRGKLNVSGTITGNSKAAEVFADSAKINGEIVSTGAVKVGQESVIIGNISATSAVIAGAVKGDIDVQGPFILDTSAIVMGDIKSKSVQINNGAVIEGHCSQCYADVSPTSFFDEL